MMTNKPPPSGNVTLRQVFDFVKEHLLTQGGQSLDVSGICRYRGPHGTSCAVGCLIPDHKYNPLWEGANLISLNKHHAVPLNCIFDFIVTDYPKDLKSMLDKLQYIHDSKDPLLWKQELEIMQAEWFG